MGKPAECRVMAVVQYGSEVSLNILLLHSTNSFYAALRWLLGFMLGQLTLN